ncbi:MAG: AlwI family type II restriction endonuclease, partial [Alphaproteobacteria bacterium]|nr:AlwI family type II restriction endonuclease [Alphaproteobacteria bacterium]
SFEGQDWTPALQAKFLNALRKARLSVGQTTALPRMLKRVYENLGLCWVAAGEPIRLTPAGQAYLRENGRSRVLNAQAWRYQLPNPLNSVSATRGISLFPHHVVVQVLLACNGYITAEEFVLFVARIKRPGEIPATIARIAEWRKLPETTRTVILNRLAKTKYGTIKDDSGYTMAFHRCDLLLERRTDRLSVTAANSEALRKLFETHSGLSTPIEFKGEPDTIAFYGEPGRQPTQIEALEYYVDVSDVKNAVAAFRKLPKEVRGDITPEEFEREQLLEKDLEEYLEKRLDEIEPGLKWKGRQFPTTVGPIDLFAQAKNGDLVVIELKKGRAADKVFGQICRYMGCIKSEYAKVGAAVRGIIVGREIDVKLRYAAKAVPDGLVNLATFELKNAKGSEGWVKVSVE